MLTGKKKNDVLLFLGVALMLPLVGIIGGRIYNDIVFDINCGDRIKRAADANSIELAVTELEAVVAYAEQQGYTQGYTSVLWRQPSEDVGFWFTNVKTALDELKAIPHSANVGDKANVLKKLRETLIDHKEKGDTITVPSGIYLYPHNKLWFWGTWAAAFSALLGVGTLYGYFNPA